MLFLSFVTSTKGIAIDEGKIESIKNWPSPSNTTEVRRFHCLATFYRMFIKGFNSIIKPITNCLKYGQFKGGKEQEESFQLIKDRLSSTPLLAVPNKVFEVESNTSKVGIGAILSQDGRLMEYFSEKLNKAK